MRNVVEAKGKFIEHLKNQGWVEEGNKYKLRKDNWIIVFDTSSWIEVGTKENARVFDVPVPDRHLFQWT